MSGILPQSMGEYLAAGATEWIPTARFEAIEAGDLVCQVHNGGVLQAAVAQTLTVGHDGKTRVWRAADGGTVAWEDEPSNADSHLVIYRRRPTAPTQDGIVLSMPVPAADLPAHTGAEIHFRIEGIAVQAVLCISTLSAEYPGYVYLDIEQPHPTLGFYLPADHPVYILQPAASAEVAA